MKNQRVPFSPLGIAGKFQIAHRQIRVPLNPDGRTEQRRECSALAFHDETICPGNILQSRISGDL